MTNAFDDDRGKFLQSEKDTRPYWETERRGLLAPVVGSGYNNKLSWGMPEALGGHGASVFKRAVDSAFGKETDLTPEEINHGAQGASNFMFMGGLAGNIGKRPQPGTASMFGGTSSKTADMGAHNRANAMDSAGVPREQIWNDTGWFKGVDGKWRNEIDDGASGITAQFRNEPSGSGQWAPNALVHDDLYKAYPDTKSLFMQKHGFPGGAFDEMTGTIHAGGFNGDQLRSTALHEMQHAVQGKEGFASGGAGADVNYNALAGEVEARAVQARMDLTPAQRRARPPWLDYDVPETQQIVRFGSDGPQMSSNGAQPPKVPDLPMDQASRMQRARDMGFDTDKVWYHGTKDNFDEFDLKKFGASDQGLAGKGAYFTYNPEEASGYAMNETFGRGQSPSVIPAYLNMKNPFMIKQGVLPDGRTIQQIHGGPITSSGGKEVRKLADDGGHDGIVFANKDGDPRHAVTFDPRNIRSVNAAFDPAMRDSANLLAANPATGAIVPLTGNAFDER